MGTFEIGVILPGIAVQQRDRIDLREAARHGPSPLPPLARGRTRLIELAAEQTRPTPFIAIGATSALGTATDLPSREEIAAGISSAYARPLAEVTDIPLTGHPKEAADKLAAYRDAGATSAIIGISGGDWRAQVDLLAATRHLLQH
ncbi:hypothetical protein ACTWPT_20355 [Nonomuraea sp. 3N208]|uniref:hypothetical protein n=1 Tax=Nonomuraea sp. 3N208 TaxID=3457421 RepID=UPI003FCC570E